LPHPRTAQSFSLLTAYLLKRGGREEGKSGSRREKEGREEREIERERERERERENTKIKIKVGNKNAIIYHASILDRYLVFGNA
jgi:hypothetical protein